MYTVSQYTFRQRFVPSIGNIEKTFMSFQLAGQTEDREVLGSTENFCNFPNLSYF